MSGNKDFTAVEYMEGKYSWHAIDKKGIPTAYNVTSDEADKLLSLNVLDYVLIVTPFLPKISDFPNVLQKYVKRVVGLNSKVKSITAAEPTALYTVCDEKNVECWTKNVRALAGWFSRGELSTHDSVYVQLLNASAQKDLVVKLITRINQIE
jgi:hypothetical protein